MSESAMLPAWLEAAKAWHDKHANVNFATYQQQLWDEFLQLGLPTRKSERYKYIDFSLLNNLPIANIATPSIAKEPLVNELLKTERLQQTESVFLVFVNGDFVAELSDLSHLPKTAELSSLSAALKNNPDLLQQEMIDYTNYPFAALNGALFSEGIYFALPDDCEMKVPLHILNITLAPTTTITMPRHVFQIGKRVNLTVLEEYSGQCKTSYFRNSVQSIHIADSAKVNWYKLQKENNYAVHIAHSFAYLGADSQLNMSDVALGAALSRDDISILLQAPGASAECSGLYYGQHDKQVIDHHVDIEHLAARTTSEMLYKGIIDKNARAIFNGRLYVKPDAQKITAFQGNHNILLSDRAEVYSKPELEIYADDVRCKHGATTGQLNEIALFYLRSRGIDETAARAMLLSGFLMEIYARITHPSIKLRIEEMV